MNEVEVYIDLSRFSEPRKLGTLIFSGTKYSDTVGFETDSMWLKQFPNFFFDPDINSFIGIQYPILGRKIFNFLNDGMPDTWGRKLILRYLKSTNTKTNFNEFNFLFLLNDFTRLGAIRYKFPNENLFLGEGLTSSIPPLTELRNIEDKIRKYEDTETVFQEDVQLLLNPGSSLGGARPKCNLVDEKNNLWIAKSPSVNDTINKGAWEYVYYKLAINCGIIMADCKLLKGNLKHSIFLTKRFDRKKFSRIHFSSAMSALGYSEDLLKDSTASYLEIAEFIRMRCVHISTNLEQLWKRIAFNIITSNCDDHLRNHGFILNENLEWNLSPAFDLNPSSDKTGLSLNISLDENDLDLDLLLSVCSYFDLDLSYAKKTLKNMFNQIKHWRNIANEIKISRSEQNFMEECLDKFLK